MSAARDHDRWADSVGPWMLGALPEDEVEGFRAHLESCAECRADAESLRVAVDALPASAAPMRPPPELKGRLMAVVEREASLLQAAGPDADRAKPPRRRRRFPSLAGLAQRPALATGLVLLLLVVGGGAALLGRTAVDQDSRTIVARVNPELTGSRASLEVDGDRARIVGSKLPPPPVGHVYQVWLDRGGKAPEPTSALFSTRRDGSASVDVPGSLDGVRAVMVTDEPSGGSEKPTGRLILTASPA
jgi:Anti-sigma-K factor rskA, C-terminal/Putative zinc-finger